MTDRPSESDHAALYADPDVWLRWADMLLKMHGPAKALREALRCALSARDREAGSEAAMWDAVAHDLETRGRRPDKPVL